MKYTNEGIDQVFSDSINKMDSDPYVRAMKKARASAPGRMKPKQLREFALTLGLSEEERDAVMRVITKGESK